jgi:hypothetical protein
MSISSLRPTGHSSHFLLSLLIFGSFFCRLELIDDAMLRPGRLGKLLYVPLPSASDRTSILTAICRYGHPLGATLIISDIEKCLLIQNL